MPDASSQEKRASESLKQPSADRSRRLAARRQYRRRQLIKAGLARFTVAANPDRLVGYLIETGRIDEQVALNHRAVEKALTGLVEDVLDSFAEASRVTGSRLPSRA